MSRYLFWLISLLIPLCLSAKVVKEKKGFLSLGVDVIFEMKDVEEELQAEGSVSEVNGTMYNTGAVVRIGFSPVEWFEVFAHGGVGNVFFGVEDFPYGMYLTDFSGSYEGKYGGGVRFNFLNPSEKSPVAVFVETEYTRVTSRDIVQEAGWGTIREVVDWQELEVLLGVKKPFSRWSFSGGVRGSELFGTHTVENVVYDMKSAFKIGVFADLEIYFDPLQKTGLFLRFSLIDSNTLRFGFRRWF